MLKTVVVVVVVVVVVLVVVVVVVVLVVVLVVVVVVVVVRNKWLIACSSVRTGHAMCDDICSCCVEFCPQVKLYD